MESDDEECDKENVHPKVKKDKTKHNKIQTHAICKPYIKFQLNIFIQCREKSGKLIIAI